MAEATDDVGVDVDAPMEDAEVSRGSVLILKSLLTHLPFQTRVCVCVHEGSNALHGGM